MLKMLMALGLLCILGCSFVACGADAKAVDLVGTLQTGLMAMGGETTGTAIETADGSYELDLSKDAALQKKAESLNGKKVRVTGTLEIRKGVEIPQRKIVVVSSLAQSEK